VHNVIGYRKENEYKMEFKMPILSNFKNKDFVEQITILNRLGSQEPTPELIQKLFELYLAPIGDKPVDAMVEHILCDLLSKNEKETIKGLSTENLKVKRLCLQIAGRHQFKAAEHQLIKMVKQEKDPTTLHEIFVTMSKLKTPEFLSVFRKNLYHPDELNAAVSIMMIGKYNDQSMIKELFKIVEDSDSGEQYEKCSLLTAQALESLSLFGTAEVIEFFVSKLHHKNPSVRRIIQEELIKIGAPVIPFVKKVFEENDVDNKIMASNLLGQIGDKEGGEVMIDALDSGKAVEINVRFAIYEAFGNIKFMKGLVCLLDGLSETDPSFLICVITSLNKQFTPFILDKIKEYIQKDEEQGDRILNAISSAKALNIFAGLYQDTRITSKLIKVIAQSHDQEVICTFREKLKTLNGKHQKSFLKTLDASTNVETGFRILAVDDSKSMLSFYRKVLSDWGSTVTTALNGQEALHVLETQEPVDLIITDMNMPVMDGIEFTRKLKENTLLENIPVIMATTESESLQQQLACSAGVNDFIIKPITPAIFIEKIRKNLPG
jgi:CheY-like chemotaxis protein